MITFDEVAQAVDDAEALRRKVDHQAVKMANMIVGRLRSSNISGYTLERLKRELRSYNIHTQTWRD